MRTNAARHLEPLTAGSLSGRVVNDTGVVDFTQGVRGVMVILRSLNATDGVRPQHKITNAAGQFYFGELEPINYAVQIDPISIPEKFKIQGENYSAVKVRKGVLTKIDLPLIAERAISGFVFIDTDGNGQYEPGKDVPVKDAIITTGMAIAVSKADGSYSFRDLPAGRIGMLVRWPDRNENTHVILHLADGPVSNRIVNIPRNR